MTYMYIFGAIAGQSDGSVISKLSDLSIAYEATGYSLVNMLCGHYASSCPCEETSEQSKKRTTLLNPLYCIIFPLGFLRSVEL